MFGEILKEYEGENAGAAQGRVLWVKDTFRIAAR